MRRTRSLLLGAGITLLAAGTFTACEAGSGTDGAESVDSVQVIPAADGDATSSADATVGDTEESDSSSSSASSASSSSSVSSAASSSGADPTWDDATAVHVTLQGDTATADGEGVDIDGSTVEITAPGTYVLTGTLADGNVEIDSEVDGLVQVVLDGVDITSSTTSPLALMKATEVVLVLADGSSNVLTDPSTYVYPDAETDEPNATLFADDPLTITGDGTLTVNAQAGDAIAGRDTVTIDAGTLVVSAPDDAIRGNDALTINGGTITVAAGGDALKSDLALTVNGGTIEVQQSYEGLEAETIVIAGGTLDVAASDDGINAASDSGSPTLTITGGDVTVDAGGDGLDVNGSIVMTGGTVVVDGPTEDRNGAIDYDGTFDISGGVLIATGSSGMAMAPSTSSSQLSLLGTFAAQAGGSTVTVTSSDGTELASVTPSKSYSSILVSAAGISADDSYDISMDGQVLDTTTTAEAAAQGGRGMGGGGGRRP